MKILPPFCLLSLLLNNSIAFASHSFAGLDMCALYPEVMPPGLEPEQLPEAGGPAAVLMESYCVQCHALPGPGRHTAEEWPQVLDRMLMIMDVAERFGGLLGNIKTPSAEQREQLRSYLSMHALKPLLSTPQGTGASAFENHCSACHALPDTAQYDVDWPSLIKRMQRNMQVMQYSPPSADSMTQIQLYLQNNKAHVDAGEVSVADNLKLGITGENIGLKNREPGQGDLGLGSWVSLGVFFLLISIGLLRWSNNYLNTERTRQRKD